MNFVLSICSLDLQKESVQSVKEISLRIVASKCQHDMNSRESL